MIAGLVCLILVVGGTTRLTESGLSIVRWDPVTGVVPPMSADDWQAAYAGYLAIPEAQSVHRGITLAEFQGLFWWEWVHRILARLVGLVIAVPFFVLLLRGRIRPALQLRLANLPILVAAQGVLGWYMVKSGLTDRTDVSPYRLVAHLGVAMLIYVIATWTAMTMGQEEGAATGERSTHLAGDRTALLVAALALVTLLSGGFVAGLDAGRVYNTFPFMGDGLLPREYWTVVSGWRNWFENPAAAQFNHRLFAVGTLVTVLVLWIRRHRANARWHLVALAALVQVALGITTLLLSVPIPVAALHQLGAVALLTTGLWAAAGRPRER